MLNMNIFEVGKEATVCEHVCKCGKNNTLIFGSGYNNDRNYLVGPAKYQCDRSQHFVRYICPECRNRNLAYGRSVFGNPKPNANWSWRQLTKEDLMNYEKDFCNEVSTTDEEEEFLANWMAP